VVREDVNKLIFVFGLQECVHGALWQLAKAFIGGCKDGEGSRRTQGVCQVTSNNSRHQSGQVIHRLSQLDNVGRGILQTSRREQDTIDDVHHSIGSLVISCRHSLEILAIWSNEDSSMSLVDMQVLAFHRWHTLEGFEG